LCRDILPENRFFMKRRGYFAVANSAASIGGRSWPLPGQDAHHTDKTSEGEADAYAINQSKSDFFAKGINRQQRPQESAFSFDMSNGSRHITMPLA